ncbi:MAG: O-antigen polymerase [Candidatus Helarchaeota archaeon]
MPSFYLFLFFSVIPIFGSLGYIYGYKQFFNNYLGIVNLDLNNALNLWLKGFLFFMVGIYSIYIINWNIKKKKKQKKYTIKYTTWNWNTFNFIIFLFFGISFIFTIITIWKIGYIPMLKGNIGKERFFFSDIAGGWNYKLARLWMIVYMLSFIKLLRNIKIEKTLNLKKNAFLFLILFSSIFLDSIYGDRIRLLILFFFSIIVINKGIKRIKLSYFIFFCLIIMLVFNFVYYYRQGSVGIVNYSSVYTKLIFHSFAEYRSFAFTIQYYPNYEYLYGETFVATLASLFPKQVWTILGQNKENMRLKSSANIMKKIHKSFAGIRIGIFGIAFINFGNLGLIFIPFLFGILFGILENMLIYIQIFNVKFLIIVFALSLLMYLPLCQLNDISELFIFNLYFIILSIIFFSTKEYTD